AQGGIEHQCIGDCAKGSEGRPEVLYVYPTTWVRFPTRVIRNVGGVIVFDKARQLHYPMFLYQRHFPVHLAPPSVWIPTIALIPVSAVRYPPVNTRLAAMISLAISMSRGRYPF